MRGSSARATLGIILAKCSLIALAATPAHAQDGAATDSSRATSDNTADTGEIVVTAQRRTERLEDVPMSVAALPAIKLQQSGVFDFDNLTRATTGIRIARTGVFTQPTIRGISTGILGAGQENNIATYVDGFYQPDQLTLSGDLVGIDNVQVLKGPQGTLYGRNATGGAILVNTASPILGQFKGSAHVGYARYNDKRADALINIPLGDRFAFNIVGHYRDAPGYQRDITGDYAGVGDPEYPPPYKHRRYPGYIKDWGVRAKLLFEISADTNITLGYRHRHFADNRAGSFFMTSYGFFPNDPGTGFGKGGYDYVGLSVPTTNNTDLDEVTGRVQIGTGIGKLTSYTSYTDQKYKSNGDFDGAKIDYVQASGIFKRKTFQQAFDYNITAIDRLDLIIGAHYFDDDALAVSNAVISGVHLIGVTNAMDTKAWAIFADATYDITDALHLTLGGRYSHEKKDFTSVFSCCGPIVGVGLFSGVHSASFSNFTPRGVLRYEIGPRSNVYASISRGFKSGTFNTVGQSPISVSTPAVDPETITAYEVGFKSVQEMVRIEAAAYYYDYKNLQLSRLFVTGAGIDQSLANAASAEIYGAELTIGLKPVRHLNLEASVNYNHARYKDFPDGAGTIPIGGFLTTVSQDYSGYRIPRAADWTLNISADYTIEFGDSDVVLAANAYYSSKYTPNTPSYDPATGKELFEQPGYMQANISATWHSPNDRFELGVYLNNLTNKRYRPWYNAAGLGAWYFLSEPRVWGVKAGVNF
jgi:iron complex outermembrane receptor protein